MSWWWVRRRLHVSWLIALTCALFVVGVWAAQFISLGPWLGWCGLPLLAIGFWRQRTYALLFVALGGLMFGCGYGGAVVGDRSVYQQLIGRTVTLEGRVKEDPSISASGQLSLQLDEVVVESRKLPGTVLVTVEPNSNIKRGDRAEVKGLVKDPLGSFAATLSRGELVKLNRPVPGDIGRVVRDWFADEVRSAIPDPQASLGIGFLTGQKSALPKDLSEALKIAGLTHIVVASGYNLTILVRMARRLFVRVSKYLAALSSGVMISLFVAVTGLSPSMTRAGLVSGLSLLAWYYGRQFHPLVLLPFAAAVTVLIQPSYVWGDLGWQLSFAAFAGVMILAPLLQRYFFGEKEPGLLRQILGETIAAHVVTVPLIAMSFGVTSNVAIIANLLVVPLVPLAMLLTFIVGVLAIANAPFIELVAVPTHWLLSYMTTVATWLSELPWAQSEIILPEWAWAIYAAVLMAACFWMQRATKYNLRQANTVI